MDLENSLPVMRAHAVGPAAAWRQSLQIIVVMPVVAWTLFGGLTVFWEWGMENRENYLILGFFIGAIGALAQLTGYALMGLPLFRLGFKQAEAWIWKARFAIPLGLLLGSSYATVILMIVRGDGFKLDYTWPAWLVAGPLYGIWTGFWACRYGPSGSELKPWA